MHNNMDLIHNINNKLFQPDLSLTPTLDLVRQKHRMSTLLFKLTEHSSTSEYNNNTILMLAMRAKLTVTLHVILD